MKIPLEQFEDTKVVIRSRKSKDREYNGQMTKDREYNGQKTENTMAKR
jgi:hypothetical protein